MSVLLVDDNEDELGEDDSEMGGEFQSLELPETEVSPITVSMNSIVGLTNPKTLKLVGTIGDGEVVVMVDPGATHNFISLKAVEKIGSSNYGLRWVWGVAGKRRRSTGNGSV